MDLNAFIFIIIKYLPLQITYVTYSNNFWLKVYVNKVPCSITHRYDHSLIALD